MLICRHRRNSFWCRAGEAAVKCTAQYGFAFFWISDWNWAGNQVRWCGGGSVLVMASFLITWHPNKDYFVCRLPMPISPDNKRIRLLGRPTPANIHAYH